jgi:hypothetical protein
MTAIVRAERTERASSEGTTTGTANLNTTMVRFGRTRTEMPRASVLLLLGGAALIVTWLVSPASSSPDPRGPRQSPSVQPSPAATLDVAVETLHDHETASPPVYQLPSRDPFSFSTRAMAPAASQSAAVPIAAAPAMPPLPKLVAILSSPSSRSATDAGETAALSNGQDVQFVRAGEMSGAWLVKSVSAASAVLVDPASGTSVTLALQ